MITGASGLLGKHLMEEYPSDGINDIYLPYRNTELKQYNEYFTTHIFKQDLKNSIDLSQYKPDVIIHCAAEGNVDKIQQNVSLGLDCILTPTINIINEAKKLNCRLIYISTNAVFDGRNAPYSENIPLCPINAYGIYKSACEYAIIGSGINWTIIRPILMYGWNNKNQRKNWASTWIEKLRKNETCEVVNDVITQPLYAKDCAKIIWKIIKENINLQIFNIAGDDILSLYQFATIVADLINKNRNLIKPVASDYFKSLAPRPKYTFYNTDKTLKILNYKTIGIRDGISDMLAHEKFQN